MERDAEPAGDEAQTVRADERVRYLASATQDAIYDWDLRRNVVWRSEGHQALGLADREHRIEAASDWWRPNIHPDDMPRLAAAFERVVRARAPRWVEQYRLHRDDRDITVVDRAYLVYDEDGEPIRMVGALTDVSERMAMDAALRASEEKYRTLYDSSPVMMHSIDPEGRLLSVSNRWLETLGYQRDEVIGRRSIELLTEASRAYARDVVLPAFRQSGVCHDVPYQFVKKDGGIVDVLLSAITERDAGGAMVRSMAVLVDVTERNRTEAALRESEERLRHAHKMEAVGLLAGGIAHDFNNLLVVILGHAQLLMRSLPAGQPSRDDAEQIHAAGQRAASLTRQLLAFSRKQVLQPRVLDVSVLIRDTEKLLERVIREDIELSFRLGRGLGHVRADPSQIVQVLLNLVANARDAMPDGGRLVVEAAAIDAGEVRDLHLASGRYVRITVADNGCGMDDATRARVFEPFFTTKQAGQGTGLGMATVYGIVQQSGGQLGVDTELGRGTRVCIYLPCVDDVADAAPSADTGSLPTGAETILLVEDETVVRRLIARVLEAQGYAVLPASHPREALEMAARHVGRIDLLLTDVVMPVMSGVELAQRITALRSEACVIFMSGYARPVLPHGGAELGDDFLPKPFTMEALLLKVREVLTRARREVRATRP